MKLKHVSQNPLVGSPMNFDLGTSLDAIKFVHCLFNGNHSSTTTSNQSSINVKQDCNHWAELNLILKRKRRRKGTSLPRTTTSETRLSIRLMFVEPS